MIIILVELITSYGGIIDLQLFKEGTSWDTIEFTMVQKNPGIGTFVTRNGNWLEFSTGARAYVSVETVNK